MKGCLFPPLLSESHASGCMWSGALGCCCLGSERRSPYLLPLPPEGSSTSTFRRMAVWISQTSTVLCECSLLVYECPFHCVSGGRVWGKNSLCHHTDITQYVFNQIVYIDRSPAKQISQAPAYPVAALSLLNPSTAVVVAASWLFSSMKYLMANTQPELSPHPSQWVEAAMCGTGRGFSQPPPCLEYRLHQASQLSCVRPSITCWVGFSYAPCQHN